MFGRRFACSALTAAAAEVGKEKRVVLEAGKKWSEESEELKSTDMRGFICRGYDILALWC